MKTTSLLTTFLCLASLLSGCGFELRGATDVPQHLRPVHVQAPPGSRVAGALNAALGVGEVPITAASDEARLVIRIDEERDDSRVIAVDSQGKVIANELQYRVRFDAVGANGQSLAEPQTINLAREHVNPEDQVLGKAEEAQMMRNDMVQDMAHRILRRLKTQLL